MDMTEEDMELIRVGRYFDIIDTVLNKISREFKNSKTAILTKDDWEIIKNYIDGLVECLYGKKDLL